METPESCQDRFLIASGLERPGFQVEKTLFATDLQAEQEYRLARLRHHNFYLHGSGVICGLEITPARDPLLPWAVNICPGMAISPYGEEIIVSEPVVFDLSKDLWRLPKQPSPGQLVAIGLSAVDRPRRYLPVQKNCCSHHEYTQEASRLRDEHRVALLASIPVLATPSDDFCSSKIPSCPSCPENAYILLAKVNLPNNTNEVITLSHIHL